MHLKKALNWPPKCDRSTQFLKNLLLSPHLDKRISSLVPTLTIWQWPFRELCRKDAAALWAQLASAISDSTGIPSTPQHKPCCFLGTQEEPIPHLKQRHLLLRIPIHAQGNVLNSRLMRETAQAHVFES